MRVAIVDTYYPAFLHSHYSERPELVRSTYEEQREALLARSFGTSDFYSRQLGALGHHAEELVANCLPLQRQWARDRHHRRRLAPARPARLAASSLRRLLVRQVEALRPDVVYVQDVPWVGSAASDLRRVSRLLVGQHATALPDPDVFRPYDLLVSSLPNLVERFRTAGKDAVHLPLGFEPAIVDRLPAHSTPHGVVHVGGYGPIHEERNRLLEHVAKHIPVSFWGYGVETLPQDSPIRAGFRGEAWGSEMYALRAGAKVTLTKHITAVAGTHANNATLFEATGVGSCLLVDERSDLDRYFVPGVEVAVYTDAVDCVSQLEALLADDHRRAAIATAGQQRTLRDHTWSDRIASLVEVLEERLRQARR